MAVTEALRLLPIDASSYVCHPLHAPERDWPETNCYVDLWIEVLHALGHDPVAGLAFTLGVGFDGDQWEFFKYPAEDLLALYGIQVREINVWRSLDDHIATHLALGHLLTVEADSWYLPDTAGVAYRLTHQKTTIVPQHLDPANRRIGYFHNAGYFELEGEDYDGVLRLGDPDGLVPYVELVAMERQVHRDPDALRAQVDGLVRGYVARRPTENPVAQLAARITADLPWLREHPDLFHAYAFGSLRQCGAWASVAATFVRWLGNPATDAAAEHLDGISGLAKTAQFKLARVLAGRTVDLDEQLSTMASHWQHAMATIAAAYGG